MQPFYWSSKLIFYRGIKADEVAVSKSPQPVAQKILQKKERKSKQVDPLDHGDSGKDPDREHNDSFEKFYNKDLDLEEDQVPVVIYELCESAINFISQEAYEKGLILLQKAQTMLEQISAQKNPHDQFVFLLIMHNMGLCYQKLGVLDECAICIEKCLVFLNSEIIQQFFNDPYQPSLRLKLLKYKCKSHMQVCALFSQIHKHREAAHHANEAIIISHFLIHDAENMCAHYTKELIQQKPLAEVSIIGNLGFGLLQKTAVKLLPVFQAILKKVALEDECEPEEQGVPITGPLPKNHHSLGKKLDRKLVTKMCQEKSNSRIGSGNIALDVGEPDMKNILGYLNQNEWIYSLNIGNIMQVAPLTLQDFLSTNSLSVELTREYVLEKICFLCVSYFCLGTEFRFLHLQNEVIQGVSFQRKDSEYWHGKAVELAISFLPSESPLVSHVLMSYEKHHSPSNMPIPEDNSQDVKVRVVRQLSGVESNKLQPIIRYHPDTDYRVRCIMIKPLDYYEINYKSQKDLNQRRNRNQDVRQTSLSLGRQNTATRRSIQFQAASNQTSSKQSNVQDKMFKQTNVKGEDLSEGKNLDDVDVEDSFSKQALTGVLSPTSDELAAGFMKLEDQKSMSLKKSQKKVATHIYNTLNRTSEIDKESIQKTAAHVDVEITDKDKQRQSEVGISQKHRRLQTSDLQKILQGTRAVDHSSQIELPRDQNLELGAITEEQRKYLQERRARSSLSNRHISQKQMQVGGPDEESPATLFQPLEGTLSQNLLAFNANQQRLTIQNQELASNKNQRLIVEQLEDHNNKSNSLQVQHRQNSAKRRQDDLDTRDDDLMDIQNQIRNSGTEIGHHQRSSTVQTTTDFSSKRHLIQNNSQGNQKSGAPITDIRAKPQSVSTTANISANNLDDLNAMNDLNRQSAQLVPNLTQNVNSRKTKMGVAADKANLASHLNQQMLLQHMMQQQPVQLVSQQNGSRSSQNQLSQLYQQQLSATQKLTPAATVQTNSVAVTKQRRAGNSGGSQKKQTLGKTQSGATQGQVPINNSVLTNDQLVFMMQQKRDRLNQSQLVSSQKAQDLHDLEQYQNSQNVTLIQSQQQPPAGHIVNLNKLYASHRKTPTNMSADPTLQGKYQTAQQSQLKSMNGGVITSKATPQVKTALLGQNQNQPDQKRTQSQLGHNQVSYFDNENQKQQAVPYNRKSSMEGRIGNGYSAAAVGQQPSEVQAKPPSVPATVKAIRR